MKMTDGSPNGRTVMGRKELTGGVNGDEGQS